ncbi:MAG: methionine--tRNA ligase [Thermoplasmata archaeon]|nr:MAG: methionine--tRNA ligase [Thermoplasmata archaeon]
MAKIFIGVAWPYANGPIHLGHIAGCYLASDIFQRYMRMRGNDVLSVSGSDQHGTPIAVRALSEGVPPEHIAKKYHEINREALEDLGINYSLYFETSHEFHKEVVKKFFLELYNKGYIYEKTMESPYCERCNRFLPDRYIEGVCPYCGYEKARGDQCDNCGRPLDAHELINPTCKICGSTPIFKETRHLFFKLSAFSKDLFDYVSKCEHWKGFTRNFTVNWIKKSLEDRAITRDIEWGIDVPIKGYEGKKIYVWFEAVIGYFSASKKWCMDHGNRDRWREFWQDYKCKHYYFLGKDNIPFHTIIWPAMLMAHGELNLPYNVVANQYLMFRGEQFSKSRGNVVSVRDFLQVFDPDALRYYIAMNMPEHHDTDFTWEDFVRRNNNELVATLGNFIHRALTFTHRHYGMVPDGDEDDEVSAEISMAVENVGKSIENCEFRVGLEGVMALAKFGNKYFDKKEPWAKIKVDKDVCASILYNSLRIVKALAHLMAPYLPFSASKVWKMLGYDDDIHEHSWNDALEPPKVGQRLSKPVPLFRVVRLEDANIVMGVYPENLNLRVGRIVNVNAHPHADKLYVLTVDLGDERRTLVAGLRPYYAPDMLRDEQIVVLCNLKPAKLRGILSEGMLLAAEDKKGNVALIRPARDAIEGTYIRGATSKNEINIETFNQIKMFVGEAHGKIVHGDANYKVIGDVQQFHNKKSIFISIGEFASQLVTEEGFPIVPNRDIEIGARVR